VKEESHLEEMRAALRGDRERAEQARQRSHENIRALVEPTVPADGACVETTQSPAAPRRGVARLFRRR